VTLKEEIEFIKNYIALHKMRYHKNVDINFSIEVEDENVKIMPLLFIILVENAFKHGVEKLRSNAFVNLKLKATKNENYFEVENNFEKDAENLTGIGLENLKRRLELVYPNRFQLKTSEANNKYNAQLKIQL